MWLIFLFLIIILLITNNQAVISGASYGLMLWYKSIVPLLLPFMLISGIIEKNIIEQNNKKSITTPSILFLGLFCGYPIGAKASSTFVKEETIDKRTGNLLLPLCNNVSPMFFLGFVLSKTLKNSISPALAYTVIFLPYILVLLLELIIIKLRYKSDMRGAEIITNANLTSSMDNHSKEDSPKMHKTNNTKNVKNLSISEQSINQITMVGLYIMLCSIITEFMLSIQNMPETAKHIAVGITEITRGVTYISQSGILSHNAKTALILACTSFGGISSVMQTSKVIQGSGLSLLHYTVIKSICAVCTYYLCLLII